MSTAAQVVRFALGIALVWGGTETVLRRVPRVAAWLRVSPLAVTVLLIAVLTSLPEFCVSLLVLSGVVLQMLITTGQRFVRLEAIVMIAPYALFLAAQFSGLSISLP